MPMCKMIISSSSNKYSYFMNMINDLRKHYKIVEMFFIENFIKTQIKLLPMILLIN